MTTKKTKTNNRIRTRLTVLASTLSFCEIFAVPVHAADSTSDAFVNDVIAAILQIITSIVRWAGVLMVVYGVYMFVSGLRNEDIESKHRAITFIVVGIAMVFADVLLARIDILGIKSGSGGGGGGGKTPGIGGPIPVIV